MIELKPWEKAQRQEAGVKKVNSFCAAHCENQPCSFVVTVRGGRAVHLTMHPKMKYPPCAKGWTLLQKLYHPDRVLHPMKRAGERGSGKWERISWDEALSLVADGLGRAKAKWGNESIVMYHYVAQHSAPGGMRGMAPTVHRLFNLWGGCIFANERGNLCWHAMVQAMRHLYGTWKVGLPPDADCKTIILWGTNPAVTGHRGPVQSLFKAKEKGTKIVVVDPVFTQTAAVLADEYIPIRPGTDTALGLAMLNLIIKKRFYDENFLIERTNAAFLVREDNGLMLREKDIKPGGSDVPLAWDRASGTAQPVDNASIKPELDGRYEAAGLNAKTAWQVIKENAAGWSPDRAQEVTGVPAPTIEKLADYLGRLKPSKITWHITGGFQRTTWGEDAVFTLGALNALTGNVRGVFRFQYEPPDTFLSAPVTFDVGIIETMKRFVVANRVKKRVPITRLAEAILNPDSYGANIRALFVMNGNPANQGPDSNKFVEALKKLDFVAVCDSFMSATARHADLVLPVTTILERDAIYEGCETGPNYYVYLYEDRPKLAIFSAEKAVEPLGESKDDFEIVCELAKKMGVGEHFPWKNSKEWLENIVELARTDERFPWLKSISLSKLQENGITFVDAPEPELSWRANTPSSRIELYSEALLKNGHNPFPIYREPSESGPGSPELAQKYPLNLVSPKFNLYCNSSFVNNPGLLELGGNDLLICPDDAAPRGIKDGDDVVISNDRGLLRMRAKVSQEIIPGTVRIHQGGWPEYGNVNLLTCDRVSSYGESTTVNDAMVEVKKSFEN